MYDQIWPGKVISAATLSSGIKAAREAIGDNGRDQLSIQTIQGRGFHFIANVSVLDTYGVAEVAVSQNDTKIGSLQASYPSIAAGLFNLIFSSFQATASCLIRLAH